MVTSLLECQVAALANIAQVYLAAGVVSQRRGTAHGSIVPYQCFPIGGHSSSTAGDNSNNSKSDSNANSANSPASANAAVPNEPPRFIAVGALNNKQFKLLVGPDGLDLPDVAADPRFATNPLRVQHQSALLPLITARLRTADAGAVLTALAGLGVPVAPVLTVAETMNHPQVLSRGMVQFVDYPQSRAECEAEAAPASSAEKQEQGTQLALIGPAVKIYRPLNTSADVSADVSTPSAASSSNTYMTEASALVASLTSASSSATAVGNKCPVTVRAGEVQLPMHARRPPPFLGQHTEVVLTEVLGLSEQEVEALKSDKVVVQNPRWSAM